MFIITTDDHSKLPGLAFGFIGLVLFHFGHHCTGSPHNLSLSSSLLSNLNIKNNLLHNLALIQFLLPLLVAGIANAAIYCKLKVDIVNTFTFIDDKADIDMGAWRLL